MFVVDADMAMQKKTEVKTLLELANHHATFAVDPILKTEGVIDLLEDEAMDRFAARMDENGGYRRQQQTFIPSGSSVTTEPLPFTRYYVDFRAWEQDLELRLRYNGTALLLERAVPGSARPGGGRLLVTVVTEEGEELRLAPKIMVGPSHVVTAYVDESPLLPILPSHSFPVVSVEELKH